VTEPGARRTSESLALALLLATGAGAIEAYSIVVLGAFAGAQTGNIVLGSIELSKLHWAAAVRYGIPIIAFIGGVLLASSLRTEPLLSLFRRPFRALLAVELLTLVVVGFLPDSSPRLIASILITVTVASQAATFRTLVDVGYNSAFTTGNLMNVIGMAHTAIVKRDHAAAVHARRVGIVICFYTVGAIVGAVCSREFGRHGVWAAAVLLAAALGLFISDERSLRQSVPE
jgi:uncharacterized membrane protein YoaK (UPF0700 family)